MKARILLAMALTVIVPAISPAESETPLEKQMQILARGMRELTARINDPARLQENISLLETLRKTAAESATLDPKKTATVSPSDREAFRAGYRAQMGKLERTFTATEDLLKSGDTKGAGKALLAVGPLKKEGHSRYKLD